MQVSFGFSFGRDGVAEGHGAASQALQLREDEPHPVGSFAARGQFLAYLRVAWILRRDKALHVEWVGLAQGELRAGF